MAGIVVAEDDAKQAELVRLYLERAHHTVTVVSDGRAALDTIRRERPDLVVLDLMMPILTGIEVCRVLRTERVDVLVLMLTALSTENDMLFGLDIGADDYMTKPFSIEELLARITATLRRTRPAAPTEQQAPPVIAVGGIIIDLALQQVRRDGQPVHLTPTEFALLRELAVNRGKLLTHAHLLRRVWGHGYETETEYLRVYVRRLRAKLEADDSAPLILTQPRAGYRLAPE
jgi:two-component system KDP operon response regulator KdpE